MATRLEKLLESIDPARTIDQVSAATDEAFNSFRCDHPIRSFDDYKKYMSAFVQYVEQTVVKFKSNDPFDKEFFWTRYSNLVSNRHGRDAWKMNYEKITTGKDGGLYKLLKDVAAMILDDRSGREISARVWRFWESLTNGEKLETVDEFLQKFGHLLPSEYTSGGGAYLKVNFPRVLEKYPQLLMEIRRAMI
ncbi:MAG: hypothetical protein C0403_19575 [Desulfobacterium sp.]|nr:hypothetical protein [Desulfobacterium sp.]